MIHRVSVLCRKQTGRLMLGGRSEPLRLQAAPITHPPLPRIPSPTLRIVVFPQYAPIWRPLAPPRYKKCGQIHFFD